MRIDRLYGPEPESKRTIVCKDTENGNQEKDPEIEKKRKAANQARRKGKRGEPIRLKRIKLAVTEILE